METETPLPELDSAGAVPQEFPPPPANSYLARFKGTVRKYWRTDPLFPLAVVGCTLTAWSIRQIVSPLFQPFKDFITPNREHLLWAALGLILFVIGSLGRSAVRLPWEKAASGIAPRPPKPRLRVFLLRAGGAVMILLGALGYAHLVRELWKLPVGLDQPAILFAALILAAAGLAFLEAHRSRGWLLDLGLGRYQRSVSFWRRDEPWLAVFLVIWFSLMLLRLETRSGFFHGDEATVVQYGRATWLHDDKTKNASPWLTAYAPYMAGIPRVMFQKVFTWSPYFGPRLCTLIISTLTLTLLFIFTRAHFDRLTAWLTLILAATHHVMMAFSRMAILSMDGMLLLTACMLCWFGAYRSRRASLGFLAGVLGGLSYYTYHGALLAFPILAVVITLQFIRFPKSILKRWRLILALGVGLVLAAAPIHIFYRKDPNGLKYRTRAVSVLTAENLARTFKETNTQTLPAMFISRSWPAVGGVLLWPDTSSNYDYRGLPIFDRDTLALMLLGLVAAIPWMRRRRVFELLVIWCVLGITLGSLLTTSPLPPYVPRVMMAFPPMFMLGGWVLAGFIRRAWFLGGWKLAAPFILAVMAWTGSIAARNIDHYHFKYLNDLKNGFYLRVQTGFMQFLRTFPPDAHMILYADHMDQMYTSCHAMFDTGFPRDLIVERDKPIPPPSPTSPKTAYIFRIPQYKDAEDRFLAAHPGSVPIEIKYLHIDAPPTHHVYWVDRPN